MGQFVSWSTTAKNNYNTLYILYGFLMVELIAIFHFMYLRVAIYEKTQKYIFIHKNIM